MTCAISPALPSAASLRSATGRRSPPTWMPRSWTADWAGPPPARPMPCSPSLPNASPPRPAPASSPSLKTRRRPWSSAAPLFHFTEKWTQNIGVVIGPGAQIAHIEIADLLQVAERLQRGRRLGGHRHRRGRLSVTTVGGIVGDDKALCLRQHLDGGAQNRIEVQVTVGDV